MRVYSLPERFERLEADLLARPMRISAYEALPFAIVQYLPEDEWQLRSELRRCATRLASRGKQVQRISLADLVWEIIADCEGLDAIVQLEQTMGFVVAQRQVQTYLADADWGHTLVDTLAERLNKLDPARDVAFLWRAAALAPNLYFLSKLLDEMQGRTRTPTVLLYPGALQGPTKLYFMNIRERDALLTSPVVRSMGFSPPPSYANASPFIRMG
jgi:hypothetical protein